MQFNYQLTQKEYVESFDLLKNLKIRKRVGFYLILSLIAIAIGLTNQHLLLTLAIFLVMIGGDYLSHIDIVSRFHHQQAFKTNSFYFAKNNFTLLENGFKLSNEYKEMTLKWSAITTWVENKKFFYIVFTNGYIEENLIFPKRNIVDDKLKKYLLKNVPLYHIFTKEEN